ncbi:hypothetical protein [Pseudomonas sp. TE50-2]|uniref:hypothetical protein n=1 Tax=Pseudomonas sp. TE50-2 TaxID=3142707 RepID=UPI0034653615
MTTANDFAKMSIKMDFDKQAKGKSTITYQSFYSEGFVAAQPGMPSPEEQAKADFKGFKDALGVSGDAITYEVYEKARLALQAR